MRQVEATGSTREEAIQKALEELGVEMADVDDIEVLDEGTKGIFGIGARPARVRVTVKKLPPIEKSEQKSTVTSPKSTEKSREVAKEAMEKATSSRSAGKSAKASGNEQKPAKKASETRGERTMSSSETSSSHDEPKPAEKREKQKITEEQGKEAAALLEELLHKMGITDAVVQYVRTEDDVPKLEITSQDGALVIGRKGVHIESIQFLLNRMYFNTEEFEGIEKFVVDTENYLARRRETLRNLAKQKAEQARRTGKRIKLSPMPSHERRIIHLTLQNDKSVETYSVGKEGNRCVVIVPRRRHSGYRDRGHRGSDRRESRRGSRGRNEARDRRGRFNSRYNNRRSGRSPYNERDIDPGQVSE